MQLLEETKQVKRTISYGRHEERVLNIEDYLMVIMGTIEVNYIRY